MTFLETTTETRVSVSAVTKRLIGYTGLASAVSVAAVIFFTLTAITPYVPPMLIVPSAFTQDATNSVRIRWTAKGDDATSGRATAYDVRYKTVALTESNWSSATQVVGEPTPKTAGGTETMTVTGLSPKTKYYFGIKSVDERGNWSAISNIVSSTTLCTESWSCSAWSACQNSRQTRTCVDMNDCRTDVNKPDEARACTAPVPACEEDWSCSAWSACENSRQTRTCTDGNDCGTTEDKPGTSRQCTGGGDGALHQDTYIVAALNAGAEPKVRVLTATGKLISEFLAYESGFRGGVRVAVGDLGHDGIDEIITSPGPGREPLIRIYNYKGQLIDEFYAYDKAFKGGVNVAVGNVDGRVGGEIITAPASAGGPIVQTFGYRGGAWKQVLKNIVAYNPNFRGGISLVVANVNGMGRDELLVVPSENSGGPHVRMYTVIDGAFQEKILGFMAYDRNFRGGVSFGRANVNGGRPQEILTSPMTRGGPHVRVFGWSRSTGQLGLINPGYFVFDPNFRGGVSVTGGDIDFDNRDEWIAAVRSGDQSLIKIFSRDGKKVLRVFTAFPSDIKTGILISSGHFFSPSK